MNTADNTIVQALVEILASLASNEEHRFAVFNEVNAFDRAISDEIRGLILDKLEETHGE